MNDMNENQAPRRQEQREGQERREGQGRQEGSFADRRRKVDWVVRMAAILSFIAWIAAFTVWLVIDYASPEKSTLWNSQRLHGDGGINTEWNESLLPIALILLVLSLGICVAAFIFNMTRMKRKTDKYRKSIIIIGLITIAGIIAFIIRFGEYFLW